MTRRLAKLVTLLKEAAPRVEQYLSKLKVIRKIAAKIIDFLSQIEDLQKELWLKKKFLVETSWCVRVGCIPEEFYPDSAPLKAAFLKAHPTLVVDTRHFDDDFTFRLLDAFGDVDEEIDGVLSASENFQGLSLAVEQSQGLADAVAPADRAVGETHTPPMCTPASRPRDRSTAPPPAATPRRRAGTASHRCAAA